MEAHDCPLPLQLQCCLDSSHVAEEFQRLVHGSGGNVLYFTVLVLVLGENGPSLTNLRAGGPVPKQGWGPPGRP